MELDRPHHRTTPGTGSTSSELFICFTSRLSSSSSMKIGKSILSPGRARDPPISLSTSLSRRLRTNGSIKGGQASPMFPTGGKKRGCAFENPEPSSPKVTCIGQVRVKTKKKVKHTRSLSRRRSTGEVSFRKVEQLSNDELKNSSEELGAYNRTQQQQKYAPPANSSSHFQQQECLPHRNQRWVNLPVSICEALRAFGAEFSCLFPCRSSCFSTNDREKEEKAGNIGHGGHREEGNNGNGNDNNAHSSCGAVFASWFVALHDCEGGKSREIELVVGGGDEEVGTEVRERTSMRSSRRHVFEDIEFKEEMIAVKGEEEDEKARVSICIPPKNALLLMRCRSDPMKMATLANRFWESPAPKDDDENEAEEEEDGEGKEELEEVLAKDPEIENEEAATEVEDRDEMVEQLASAESNDETQKELEKEAILGNEMQEFVQEDVEDEKPSKHSSEGLEESEGKMQALVISEDANEAEEETDTHSFEDDLLDEEMAENMQKNLIQGQVEEEEREEQSMPTSCDSFSSEENSDKHEEDSESETLKKEATEFFLAEEAALEEENGAKTCESTLEEEAEISHETSTSLEEETENDETKKTAATLLLSEPDDSEDAPESERVEQIEAGDGQESREPPQEDDADDDGDKKDEIKGTPTEKEAIQEDRGKENSSSSSNMLPECLLMMMCEPKLSMEVCKETWVCSTDFIRWLPERRPAAAVDSKNLVNAPDEPKKKVCCNDSNPPPPMGPQAQPQPPPPQEIVTHQLPQQEVLLPPRSSCSLPAAAAVSMAAMIEQKLVNAAAYEPFVLTRCKSEPMRTAAAKLMPEACFWKNRKLEPHRSATFGVGAAGVGF